jgi:predicted small metal-binding protein
MERTVTCACGESFTAADDEELFRLARRHADETHPEIRMSDEQIRGLIRASARERGCA